MTTSSSTEPVPRDAHEALLELCDRFPIVALGEAHWVEEEHALIRGLLRDDRFAELVDDIVVEFGNAKRQETLDRYVSGDAIDPATLSRVWRDCLDNLDTHVFDSPVYAGFFAAVRAAHAARGSKRPRVLLADPPYVSAIAGVEQRDEFFASLVAEQVIERGRRGLLLAGGGHLGRIANSEGGSVVQRIERRALGSCVVVLPHFLFPDVAKRRPAEAAALERKLARWPMPSLALIRNTWLGDVDATLIFGDVAIRLEADGSTTEVQAPFLDENGASIERVCLGQVIDAYLYLGPTEALTLAAPGQADRLIFDADNDSGTGS